MLRPAPSVLVIDDNAVDREHVRRLLGSACTVREAATARDGISAMARGSIDCVLLDIRLPDGDGLGLLSEIRRDQPRIPVIMATAYGDSQRAIQARHRLTACVFSGALRGYSRTISPSSRVETRTKNTWRR